MSLLLPNQTANMFSSHWTIFVAIVSYNTLLNFYCKIKPSWPIPPILQPSHTAYVFAIFMADVSQITLSNFYCKIKPAWPLHLSFILQPNEAAYKISSHRAIFMPDVSDIKDSDINFYWLIFIGSFSFYCSLTKLLRGCPATDQYLWLMSLI